MEALYRLLRALNLLSDSLLKFFFILFIALSFVACNRQQISNHTIKYFRIAEYFQQQADNLSQSDLMIEKKLYVSGRHDTILIHARDINWEKEFSRFVQCDINKAAYQDAYEISSFSSGEGKTMRYVAAKSKLIVRNIEIHFDESGNVLALNIQTLHTSLINKTETELWYHTDGYGFRQIKKPVWWGGNQMLVVESHFLEPIIY
ncbi:MAG: hypothetical protein IAE67_06590 [Candidatus Competibacteraceae bacterium]|nr:hypothetical protein [Candidatus Competibacteraceae bacterium]